jgi:acyl-CoA reductase-like NAD-dependent aldehyde dehydrogenase
LFPGVSLFIGPFLPVRYVDAATAEEDRQRGQRQQQAARKEAPRRPDPVDRQTRTGGSGGAAEVVRGVDPRARLGPLMGRRQIVRGQLPAQGFWFPPTVFTGVSQAHRIAREEIFGPVLSVLTFRTPAEAVEKANNTPFGLSAGVWTDKGSRILWMANQLRAGVVWANTFNRFDPTSPFGGYKESGYGREGGRHGLEAYLAQ